MQDFTNRIEGSWLNTGDEDLQLLGLTRTQISYRPATILKVQFFIPPAEAGVNLSYPDQLVVEAHELIPTHSYSMYSKSRALTRQPNSWNSFSPWPTRDVIDKLGVESSNLTVTASYKSAAGLHIYLPAAVIANTAVTTAPVYLFAFRTSWDLGSLEKALVHPDGSTETIASETCPAGPLCVLYNADSPFAVTVNMSGRPAGFYALHLVGHIPNNSLRPRQNISFYHPGK